MCVTGMCAPYGYLIEDGYIKKDSAVSGTSSKMLLTTTTFPVFPFAILYSTLSTNIRTMLPAATRSIRYSITRNMPESIPMEEEPYLTMEQYNILFEIPPGKRPTSRVGMYICFLLLPALCAGNKFSGRQRKRTRKDGSIYCDVRYNCMGKFRYHEGASFRESAIETISVGQHWDVPGCVDRIRPGTRI